MTIKVQDLTIEELRALISDVVKDVIGDLIEDMVALSCQDYCNSIKEARKDYQEGRCKKIEEVL
ncbi:MAG: hypothetical protein ABIK61_02095 [candidate division WOR-3 bacterium]